MKNNTEKMGFWLKTGFGFQKELVEIKVLKKYRVKVVVSEWRRVFGMGLTIP